LLEAGSQIVDGDPCGGESVADLDSKDQPHVRGEQIPRLRSGSGGANRTSQRIDLRLDARQVGQHLDRRDRSRSPSTERRIGGNALIELLQRVFGVQRLLRTAYDRNNQRGDRECGNRDNPVKNPRLHDCQMGNSGATLNPVMFTVWTGIGGALSREVPREREIFLRWGAPRAFATDRPDTADIYDDAILSGRHAKMAAVASASSPRTPGTCRRWTVRCMPSSTTVCRVLFSVIMCGVTTAVASVASSTADYVSGDARRDLIRRAQVWSPTVIPTVDIRIGPQDGRGFQPEETVSCTYVRRAQSGNSPKFHCRLDDASVVKVKYGPDNAEVYAEVMATRLLWALGFAADAQYPVTVVCNGCTADPWMRPETRKGAGNFYPAMIERPFVGAVIETREDSGWSWPELDLVDEEEGGAPIAHRDALKLLAVLMQHSDNKPEQQRIVCLDGKRTDCASPVLYLHDVGLTFGEANRFNRRSIGGVNLQKWSAAGIWKDRERCIGNLKKSATGTLTNPRISEAGRAFLASLLVQLTDQQLRDLFDVGRVVLREPNTSIDDWVQTFKRKRDDIVNHRCRS